MSWSIIKGNPSIQSNVPNAGQCKLLFIDNGFAMCDFIEKILGSSEATIHVVERRSQGAYRVIGGVSFEGVLIFVL